ncbi:MAG: apolipoprotein N-acyltransferase, partial [Candidatus Eisenbacteria bacterium]
AGERTPADGFRFGYAAGFVFFLIGLVWIAFLSKVAVTVSWIMYPAWVAAAAYCALFPALAGVSTVFARRRLGLPVALGWPLFWLAAEWLRAQGEMGFPWLHVGYTQWNVQPVLQLASIGGASGVSLWLCALNACALLAVLARTRGRRAWIAPLAAFALLLVAPFVLMGPRIPPLTRTGPPVALVQGNIPGAVKWSGKAEEAVLGKFLLLSRQAVDRGARFVIWPETSTGSYLRQNLAARVRLQGWVDSSGVAVLAGYPDYRFLDATRYLAWNAAGVFWPHTGLGPQYAKIHLVPFGERMPFQSVIPALGTLEMGQAEWTPGTDPTPLPTPLGPAGVLVCFESIFTDPARQEVLRGATWLVNVTNDEWFGRSAALRQHAAMAVFRAVEHRVPVARCANTGLTFFIDPWGRVLDPLPIFADAVAVAPLPGGGGGGTPFTRAGDVAGPASAIVAGAILLAALVLGRRRGALTEAAPAARLRTQPTRPPNPRRPR